MTDQIRISDSGGLEIERTWDGQPLWSTETEQERLFAGDAFQQMPGQLPIEEKRVSVGSRVLVRDQYSDDWYKTEVVAVHNGGSLLEVRNPLCDASDPQATVRVAADMVELRS